MEFQNIIIYYSSGGRDGGTWGTYHDEILMFDETSGDNGGWVQIGTMQMKRSYLALSAINFNEIEAYCVTPSTAITTTTPTTTTTGEGQCFFKLNLIGHEVGKLMCYGCGGYSPKMPRAVIFGPSKFGGMEWDHCGVVSLYEKLKLLIGYWRMKRVITIT